MRESIHSVGKIIQENGLKLDGQTNSFVEKEDADEGLCARRFITIVFIAN